MDLLHQQPLPRGPEAGSLARRLLDRDLRDHLTDRAFADASIVVSELVNNAVVHGEGRILLSAELRGDVLRVEVSDEGAGSPPAIREQRAGDGGGWGLRVVDAVAVRWGVFDGSTHVWAELPVA